MKISRTNIKAKIREVCEEARDNPVFITHYGRVTEVVMSKRMFDEWKEIVDREKMRELGTESEKSDN